MKPAIYILLITILTSFVSEKPELKLIKTSYASGNGISVFQFEFDQTIETHKDSMLFLNVVKNFGYPEGAYDISVFDNKVRLINNYSHIEVNHYCDDNNKDTTAFTLRLNNKLFNISKMCIDLSINFFEKILWVTDKQYSYKPNDTIKLGNNIITDPNLFEVPFNYNKAKTDSIIKVNLSKHFKLYKLRNGNYHPVDTSKYSLKTHYISEDIHYIKTELINGELIETIINNNSTEKPTPAYYNPNFILNLNFNFTQLEKNSEYKLVVDELIIQEYLAPYLLQHGLIKAIPAPINHPALIYTFKVS